MARRKRHEEHDNHEAWAIPYGDLVTLLLAFFVVMYAMSSVNEGKYRVLSDSLNEAFNGTPSAGNGANAGDDPPSKLELPVNEVQRLMSVAMPASATRSDHAATAPAAKSEPAEITDSTAAGSAPPSATVAQIPPGNAELGRVADAVTAAMGALVAKGEVHVRRYQNSVAVDISADILFDSGVARLAGGAVPVLQRLADTLRPFNNAVRVEGHTDDRPIRTTEYPSNWELSAARAASVVHLFMDRGIAPDRLAVMGLGQYRPVSSNLTPSGRNANRRVAVVIMDGSGTPEGRL